MIIKEPLPLSTHVSELIHSLINTWKSNPLDQIGYPTRCWPTFNETFGGFRPGELITLTADTGVGKSTFALNWLLDAANQGHNGFLISLEERWSSTACRLATMTNRKPFKEFTKEDVGGINLIWDDFPLWYLDHHGPVNDDVALKALEVAATERGVKFVMIDHMDYIVRTQPVLDGDAYVIGHFMRRLCGVAHKFGICILLICHPRKTEIKGINSREIGMDELKGSSSIKQESDSVISLFHPNRERNETILRFQKIRNPNYSKNTMSFIRFEFDNNNLWLSEKCNTNEWGEAR